MTESGRPLTVSELTAFSSKILEAAGYRRVADTEFESRSGRGRLFEDQFNVVSVSSFESVDELLTYWPDEQEALVAAISKHIATGEAKSWDGYLVLLAPDAPSSADAEIDRIRYNTTRVRKLVCTGADFSDYAGVARLLRPLLPLGPIAQAGVDRSPLDALPGALEEIGIQIEVSKAVISAFSDQQPLMEAIAKARRNDAA